MIEIISGLVKHTDSFHDPDLPAGHRLCRHVLYRIRAAMAMQAQATVL